MTANPLQNMKQGLIFLGVVASFLFLALKQSRFGGRLIKIKRMNKKHAQPRTQSDSDRADPAIPGKATPVGAVIWHPFQQFTLPRFAILHGFLTLLSSSIAAFHNAIYIMRSSLTGTFALHKAQSAISKGNRVRE